MLLMFPVNHVFLFKPFIYLIRATQQAVCSVVLRRFAAPSNQLLPQSLNCDHPWFTRSPDVVGVSARVPQPQIFLSVPGVVCCPKLRVVTDTLCF